MVRPERAVPVAQEAGAQELIIVRQAPVEKAVELLRCETVPAVGEKREANCRLMSSDPSLLQFLTIAQSQCWFTSG